MHISHNAILLYDHVILYHYTNSDKRRFNSSWLMEEYSVHNFTVKGCNGSKTIYSQYQCGYHSNKDVFTFAVSTTFMLLFLFVFYLSACLLTIIIHVLVRLHIYTIIIIVRNLKINKLLKTCLAIVTTSNFKRINKKNHHKCRMLTLTTCTHRCSLNSS